jgi:phosphoribosylaminoimidazolecarboxamide formyltransferase/IMP cyclohydrolase
VASSAGSSGRRALLSVHDKTGLDELARALIDAGFELWATEGTRRGLTSAGLPVRAAEELTGIGSWFQGRIKTLHPGVLGGVLAPRDEAGRRELAAHGLLPFDLVVVNFYPFVQHLAESPEATDREEFIDIGGVTLARAAAKNHPAVAVLTDPSDYGAFLEELYRQPEGVSAATRRRLAIRAFERCSEYDRAIGEGLGGGAVHGPFPDRILLRRDAMTLRYGENPHQAAAVYAAPGEGGFSPWPVTLEKGPPLSFTNLLDLDATLGIVSEFSSPTAAVAKHATPCGVASGATLREALGMAIETDPVARYGCAIAVNRPVGLDDIATLHGVFVDILAAPGFEPAARERLERRPKIKLARVDPPPRSRPSWEARSALGRLLLEETDRRELVPEDFRAVTTRTASAEERCSLDFAWRVVRYAKSNAIVLAQDSHTVGIGSGQPTRVKAVELACEVAGERARGAVLASDAFFPFTDGVEVAARAGVRAILQPGGSVRDRDVIEVAERAGIAMYFTGWRVFRH